MMEKKFNISEWKKYIPKPIFRASTEYNELYDKAWELARAHIRHIEGMPQDPYMDEGFCATQVWIWDTCFMSLFCKYAQNVFPGKETLINFYEVLYKGKVLPVVVPPEDDPLFTRETARKPRNIEINIADNPPLFAWAEYENALFHGDKEYIRSLLYDKKYLQRHYEWLENLKAPVLLPDVKNPTCWIKCEYGYKWEGGRSGMDNTPRGRQGGKAEKNRPNNPDMLWIDAICQQALSAKCISELFGLIGDNEKAVIWKNRYLEKKKIVNTFYWDQDSNFYYDIDCKTHEFYKIPTIASFWTLTSEVADAKRAKKMVGFIFDPEYFGGVVPLVSLARKDADFDLTGRYWRGSLWLPTAYAALKGLAKYGFYKEAREVAIKILKWMSKTYQEYEPQTIWEAYSPTECKPASKFVDGENTVRPDFCGWSALGPISIYIEFVLGFYEVNAFENVVKWAKPEEETGEIGIKNLRFSEIVTDIMANGNKLKVVSNGKYKLIVNKTEFDIFAGENAIEL